jgi:hypothetical protein
LGTTVMNLIGGAATTTAITVPLMVP